MDQHEEHMKDKACEIRAWFNLGMGNYYVTQGECVKAKKHYEICLNIAKQIGEKAEEEMLYAGYIGVCYCSLGQFYKGKEYLELELKIAKRKGNKAAEGKANCNLGSCYSSLGQYDKAIEHYEVDLNIGQQIGDKAGEAMTYRNLGICYYSLGQYEKAKEHHQLGLNIAKQFGDIAEEGMIIGNLGNCYCSLGQYNKAIEHHEVHLNIAKKIGDKNGVGMAYDNLGNCYHSLGQYEKAKKHLELSLNIFKQIGNKAEEGKVNGNLGNCYSSLGQYDKAKQHYELLLNIAKQVGDKAGEGMAYGNLGSCYHSLGQYEKGIEYHELNLNIARQIKDKAGEGAAHNNLGTSYCFLGKSAKAIKHHELSLNIAKQIGNKASEGNVYGNLGSCYSLLGQYDKAIEYHESSLNIAKQIGDKVVEGNAYGNLGNCYLYLGQYDKAIEHFELRVNITKEIGDKSGEGAAYCNLGTAYSSLGLYDQAIEHLKLSLNIAKLIGKKAMEGVAYGGLGSCYRSLGQYNKAIEYIELSLNITKQTGDKSLEGIVYNNLGHCYYLLGKDDKAERELRNGIKCYHEVFENAPSKDNFKVSFIEKYFNTARLLIHVLLRQGKSDNALVFAEMERSKALLELMLKRYHLRGAEREVLNMLQILEVVKTIDNAVLFFALPISVLYMWIIKPNGDLVLADNSSAHLDRDLNSLITDSREMASRPRCTDKCEDRSLSFLYQKEATKQIKTPEAATTAVEPGISQGEPASAAVGETQNSNSRDRSSKRPGGIKIPNDGPLKELYKILLAPVRHLVKGSQLVIVPDGALPLVPFAALIDEDGRYVAESLKVRLVPSLATAKMIREHSHEQGQGQASPLIVGDPFENCGRLRLPNARKEAQMIGRLLKVEPLIGERANRQAVLHKIESANLIHIASHGNAEKGEILLAPSPGVDRNNVKGEDVVLTIAHLEQKRVRAKLVVLSCCHSGCGEVKREGVIGIARAFLGAGARAVLVAIWAVDDKATFYFMEEFYKHFAKGERASEALSRAMKFMREGDEFCHPHYWAPFVLIGDDVTPLGKP